MTDKVPIRRLPTGVPGLDEVLGGGVPEFSFNLVAGVPGSGKTTLVQQIMFALASPDRRALFFTVWENRRSRCFGISSSSTSSTWRR